MDKPKCIQLVWGRGGWHSHRCKRNATMGEYCKVHHPARQAALEAKWQAERAKARAPQRRQAALEKAAKDLVSLTCLESYTVQLKAALEWDGMGDEPS